jgi:putative cofactor-binding repeat protein
MANHRAIRLVSTPGGNGTFKVIDLNVPANTTIYQDANTTLTPFSPDTILVRIVGDNVILDGFRADGIVPMVSGSGSMARAYCEMAGSTLVNPVVVDYGGTGYLNGGSGTLDYSETGSSTGGSGAVVRFTVVSGIITAGTVISPGSGYITDGDSPNTAAPAYVLGQTYPDSCVYIDDTSADQLGLSNIAIRDGVIRYFRRGVNAVRSKDVRITRMNFLDQGADANCVNGEDVRGFWVFHCHFKGWRGTLHNASACRLTGINSSIAITDVFISHNLMEDGSGSQSVGATGFACQGAAIHRAFFTHNVIYGTGVIALDPKMGHSTSLLDQGTRGVWDFHISDNIIECDADGTEAIAFNNGPDPDGRYAINCERNEVTFTSGTNNNQASVGIYAINVSKAVIKGNTVRNAYYGIRTDDSVRELDIEDNLFIQCRRGFLPATSSSTAGTNRTNVHKNTFRCIEYGMDLTSGSGFRITSNKFDMLGRAITSIAINGGGSGYPNGPFRLLTGGEGEALQLRVTTTSGVITAVTVNECGWNLRAKAAGTMQVPVDNGGGTGAIINVTVDSTGKATAATVNAGGSGYLSGTSGSFFVQVPELVSIWATAVSGVITSIDVRHTGRNFLSTIPTIDAATFGNGGSGATFTPAMLAVRGIRVNGASDVSIVQNTISAYLLGVDLLVGDAVRVRNNTIETQGGLAVSLAPAVTNAMIRGNTKARADAVTLAEQLIVSGSITMLDNYSLIGAETGTSDDLATINGLTEGHDGVLLATVGDTITVKHNTGNILCSGGADVTLSTTVPFRFIFCSGKARQV